MALTLLAPGYHNVHAQGSVPSSNTGDVPSGTPCTDLLNGTIRRSGLADPELLAAGVDCLHVESTVGGCGDKGESCWFILGHSRRGEGEQES